MGPDCTDQDDEQEQRSNNSGDAVEDYQRHAGRRRGPQDAVILVGRQAVSVLLGWLIFDAAIIVYRDIELIAGGIHEELEVVCRFSVEGCKYEVVIVVLLWIVVAIVVLHGVKYHVVWLRFLGDRFEEGSGGIISVGGVAGYECQVASGEFPVRIGSVQD